MEETAGGLGRLKGEKYVALVTYRRSGAEVFTPVWVAVVDDRLVMQTGRRTGKARRIRNNPRVRLAPSNSLGRPRGEFADAIAREITDARLGEKAEVAAPARAPIWN